MATEDRAAGANGSIGSTKFADMTVGEKVVFIVKFIIFLCSFGFAFPTLLND